MASFEVLGDMKDGSFKYKPTSSFTGAVGELIELTAGSTTWAACTSSSNYFSRKAICMEATSSASQVLAYELDGTETVKALATNNGNTAHNGDRMLLTDSTHVNNTGTDNTSQNVCFIQDGIAGATTNKRLTGRVIVGNGVDPDAT